MKKFLSVVLALVMTMSLVTITAGAKDFTDDSKIAYSEAVDVISSIGIIDGYTDGSFNPTATLTRGAAAKIICNLILGPTTGASLGADAAPFKDVPVSNVFAGYIAYCSQQGIISGYSDGTFKPSATVTGYQFMKMLLGALGYNATNEGFTGANWSVAVAKLAVSIGLDDGNDSFVGTAAMTREEACQYAYNTLQATMVEYDTTGTTIVVGGTTITSGASKASNVANSASTETIKNDNYMQFAEKYFSKLTKSVGTDDFARPATTWKFKNEKIGTYADEADATYTANVTLGTIYTDLGLSSKITANVYYNGVEGTDVLVSKGNSIKLNATNTEVGNGTLTEVYYDSDAETVDIIEVATYVGTISKSVAATSAKDAYVVVTNQVGPITSSTNTFETDDTFADDAVVLYTYAAGEIQSVALATSVQGTLTTITTGKSLTVGGTTYKYAAQKAFEDGTGESGLTVKGDYTIYLDSNGYLAYVEEEDAVSSDYAYVLALQSSGSFTENKAKLALADGTTKVVVCDDDYTDPNDDGNTADSYNNKMVTYKTNSDGEYVLKAVSGAAYDIDTTTFSMTKGTASITVDNNGTSADTVVYANSKTVFVVKTGTDTYKAYTGIANVPSVGGTVTVAYYCKSSSMITFAYIDATSATVTSSSDDVVFLAEESQSAIITDEDGNKYVTYNAVINGKITPVKVLSTLASVIDVEANVVYGGVTYNSDDIVKATTTASTAVSVTGITKLSGDTTIGFGSSSISYYTVADDCKVFIVDTDGDITESSVSSIAKDTTEKVIFTTDDGEVNYIFIQENDTGSSETPTDTSANVSSIDLAANGTITVNLTTGTSSATTYDVTLSQLRDTGYVAVGTYTVTVAANATAGTVAASLASGETYKVTYGTLSDIQVASAT